MCLPAENIVRVLFDLLILGPSTFLSNLSIRHEGRRMKEKMAQASSNWILVIPVNPYQWPRYFLKSPQAKNCRYEYTYLNLSYSYESTTILSNLSELTITSSIEPFQLSPACRNNSYSC